MNTKETLDGVKKREQLFKEELQRINEKYNVFSEIRGQGLLLGAALNEQYEGKAREFLLAGQEHGVMALIAGANVVRFTPALIISEDDIKEGLQRFEKAVAQVAG